MHKESKGILWGETPKFQRSSPNSNCKETVGDADKGLVVGMSNKFPPTSRKRAVGWVLELEGQRREGDYGTMRFLSKLVRKPGLHGRVL